MCLNLLRLAADPTDPGVGEEPHWKIDLSLPPEQLARLEPTFNAFEAASTLRAGHALAALYASSAQLAETHSLPRRG
jgi:hypothetical protein